jgi:hypothetical protein
VKEDTHSDYEKTINKDLKAYYQLYVRVLPFALTDAPDCSETSNLLNEDLHFIPADGAAAVLVELAEAIFEVTLGELSTLSHFGEGILNELLGLILVEVSTVVLIVGPPDVINALFDSDVDV